MPFNDTLSTFVEQATEHFYDARPLLPMYAHLVVSALFPIYTGAHASLSRPSSAAKPKKKARKAETEDEDEDEDKVQRMEGLSNKDAIALPVTAAITLATLYYLIKKYGADMINLIFGYYFAGVGIFSVGQLVNDAVNILVGFVFPSYFRYNGTVVRVSENERQLIPESPTKVAQASAVDVPTPLLRFGAPRWIKNVGWSLRQQLKQKYNIKAYMAALFEVDVNVSIVHMFSALFGLATVVYVNMVSKAWYLTNLQGFAVSYSALQLLSPTTFTTASLILSALFCYDIWAVFFTPLMVSVAKDLDQPIKLMFPRPDEPSTTTGEPPLKSYSMLGLGDIVIPGIVIGLALRFDLYMYYLKKQRKGNARRMSSSADRSSNKAVQKAVYVPVTGHWGDRFWTWGLPASALPARLSSSFPKPYFVASLIGYVVGMITTLGVMSVFRHAQPALLYLVPGVLLSLWCTALVRGEVSEMWNFSEASQSEEGETGGVQNASTEKNEEQSPKGLFERAWAELWRGDAEPQAGKSNDGEREAKSKKSDKATSSPETSNPKKESSNPVLVSFSVERLGSKPPSSALNNDTSESTGHNKGTKALASTHSSEDAIIVSSADLDGDHELRRSPRRRVPSRKAA